MHIHSIIRQINKDLVPQFEERLRQCLQEKDKEWLIEQIVRLTLDAHSLQENDRRRFVQERELQRAERIQRLRSMQLNDEVLLRLCDSFQQLDRPALIRDGYLHAHAPEKGTDLITESFRSEQGNALLMLAKDLLFGLLFGDQSTDTHFNRREREMLTLTLPRMKSHAIDFMKATTEYGALGTWQDPDSVSNDSRADNVILEVEFGEIEGEHIGRGILLALSLINNLEVNEQILYGRMINVEQSTLIT